MADSERTLVLDQLGVGRSIREALGGKLLGVRFLWQLERLLI